MANRSNIQGANLDVFLGTNAAPFSAVVTINPMVDIVKVLTQRYGTTPVAHLVQGHNAEVTVEFNEYDAAVVRQCLNLSGASGPWTPPAVGTQPAAFPLRLHNPHAADTTNDIVLSEVIPMNFGMTVNGQGEKKFTVTFSMQMATDGKTWQLGYTAP